LKQSVRLQEVTIDYQESARVALKEDILDAVPADIKADLAKRIRSWVDEASKNMAI